MLLLTCFLQRSNQRVWRPAMCMANTIYGVETLYNTLHVVFEDFFSENADVAISW